MDLCRCNDQQSARMGVRFARGTPAGELGGFHASKGVISTIRLSFRPIDGLLLRQSTTSSLLPTLSGARIGVRNGVFVVVLGDGNMWFVQREGRSAEYPGSLVVLPV